MTVRWLLISGSGSKPTLAQVAGWLLICATASLPLSTSAASIFLSLWFISTAFSCSAKEVWNEIKTPMGGLPVLLFVFGLIGTGWAHAAFPEKLDGLSGFVKLLALPFLMGRFGQPEYVGPRALLAFCSSCVLVLLLSFAMWLFPNLSPDSGAVPVHDYIWQSLAFLTCAAALLQIGLRKMVRGDWLHAAGVSALALGFFINIIFVVTSRTTLVCVPVVIFAFAFYNFGWRGFLSTVVILIVLVLLVWPNLTIVRERIAGIQIETNEYMLHNTETSSGLRLEFWAKSIKFVRDAPLFGHGTGSIPSLFRGAAFGSSGATAVRSTNPHNQTLAVAIQLGLVGACVLWAMWVAHLLFFVRYGAIGWVGIVVVLETVIGSLFNSFLFDFTAGWFYVLGVGIVLRILRVTGPSRHELHSPDRLVPAKLG